MRSPSFGSRTITRGRPYGALRALRPAAVLTLHINHLRAEPAGPAATPLPPPPRPATPRPTPPSRLNPKIIEAFQGSGALSSAEPAAARLLNMTSRRGRKYRSHSSLQPCFSHASAVLQPCFSRPKIAPRRLPLPRGTVSTSRGITRSSGPRGCAMAVPCFAESLPLRLLVPM